MRWKQILVIVSGLILGSLVTFYVVLSRYDFSHLKPEIARMVKSATGREVTIGGAVGLRIAFSPTLALENVGLQNAAWGSRPEMARIKRLDVQVALLPLVFGRIELTRLVLVEPDILIETDPLGRSNLVSENSAEGFPALRQSETPAQGTILPGLTMGEMEVEKGIIGFRDGPSGRAGTLTLERLMAAASSPEGVIRLRGNGAANGIFFEFSGAVGPLLALIQPGRAWPVQLTATAAGITVSMEGEMHDALRAGDCSFNLEARGPSAADLIRLVKGGSGPELGPFKVLAKLVGQKRSLSVESLDIEVGLEELVAWQFTGRISDLLARRGADIGFRVFGKDLAMVGRLAGRPIPIDGPFQLSGHVSDMAEGIYQLSDLKIAAGENDLSGSLQLDFSGGRPGISGRLASEKLDLRPFLPRDKNEKTPAGAPSREATGGRVFSSDALSLEALRKVNANLQISTRQILIPQLVVDSLAVKLVLDNGALTLNPLQARAGGGALDGRIALWPKGKAVGVEAAVKVNRLDADLLARELKLAEKPGGKLDLDFDIKGEGGSVAEIMGGLNGKTLLMMSKGRINNKYLYLLGADVGSTLLKLLNPFAQETPHVEINCLVSGFDIGGGVAQSTALVIETNQTTLVGEGYINLKTEELDLSFKPSLKEGVGMGGLGRVSLGLGELARPFKLGGTLARPAMVFDAAQAVVSIGRAVGEAALFGPATIAAFLTGGSSAEGDACLAAVDASKRGVKPPRGKLEHVEDAARKAVDTAGDKLKEMFGK